MLSNVCAAQEIQPETVTAIQHAASLSAVEVRDELVEVLFVFCFLFCAVPPDLTAPRTQSAVQLGDQLAAVCDALTSLLLAPATAGLTSQRLEHLVPLVRGAVLHGCGPGREAVFCAHRAAGRRVPSLASLPSKEEQRFAMWLSVSGFRDVGLLRRAPPQGLARGVAGRTTHAVCASPV
jgi:hypothetical protein